MTDTKSEIKYDPYQKRRHYALVFIVCGCLFIAIECLSWVGLHFFWKSTGKAILPIEFTQNFRPFSSKNLFPMLSEYRPYYMVGRLPNTPIVPRTLFGTDKHGYVVNNSDQLERDISSPSERYRIFVFGNSTIMGTGSVASLSAYLEKELNALGETKFEVITGGDDGFNSAQELSRLAMETLYFHPDMVITFNGVADAFMSSFLNDSKPNAHIHGRVIKESLNRNSLRNQSFVEVNVPSIDFFLRRFYSFHILSAIFSRIGIQLTDPYSIEDQKLFNNSLMTAPKFDPAGVEVFLENLVSISAICNVRGIRTIHFLQPTLATELIRRGENTTEAEWDLLETQGLKRTYTKSHRAEVFDKFYKYSRDGFEDMGGMGSELQNWVDLSSFFNNAANLTEVYRDAVHYQDVSTQLLSQEIARVVGEVLSNRDIN